jgi:hypothetical protein
MAALNFPNSPTVNDEVELGGKTYKWDGVKWLMIKVITPTAQALAPTITEVSNTDSEIVFTITNNDASTAVIVWEVDDATPDENSIELAAAATSSNITVDTLDDDTEYTVSATASVTGKVLSNVASLAIETDPTPVYTAATGGTTTEYDSGSKRYKSHTFTSDDDFVVTTAGNGDRNQVDYLIIAGGASGGNHYGGGGGAGGFRTTLGTQGGLGTLGDKVTVTATTYGVVIGAGGTAVGPSASKGNDGANSSALGITSTGGGAGGGAPSRDGNNGGSGGGGSGGDGGVSGVKGNGTTNQGFDGGNGGAVSTGQGGAGGGGAGEVGANGGSSAAKGGDGLANLLRTGSNETRSGGGGAFGGAGGSGGGGLGAGASCADGGSGTVNTGSGGGSTYYTSGICTNNSGAGGSGIVVIRYEIAPSV